MTWASFDDGFCREAVWDGMPYEARWYYLELVTTCCATRRWDGRLPRQTALRCTDLADPEAALRHLTRAGLVTDEDGTVSIVYIEQHVPPEGQRPDVLLPRKRSNQADYRRRKCEAGEHSKDCPRATCPVKQSKRVTARVAGNAGAGRDGQGERTTQLEEEHHARVSGDDNGQWPLGRALGLGGSRTDE